MKIYLSVLALLLFIPGVLAEEGRMTLLAVSETPNGYVGGTADLFLSLKPGSGRIFLETFPFTKVDTQMSTRFAKEVACDYLEQECASEDFFYTITANSAIIAGPSAGAAIAVLTTSLLDGTPIREDVAISGTINSGGLIGPVGGLEQKIRAGVQNGITKFLVPKGESILSNDNESFSPANLSEKLGVEIIEVSTLDEAVHHFTGKPLKEYKAVEINQEYVETMRFLAKGLCDRTKGLESIASFFPQNDSRIMVATNLSVKGEAAYEEGKYYAAASYCYGSNVEYTRLSLEEQNLSKKELRKKINTLTKDIKELDKEIEALPVDTITDLESYMVTKERISEALTHVQAAEENFNNTAASIISVAWATERLNSALSWSEFFGKPGKKFTFDQASLSKSCALKLSEVEERIQYVELFLPVSLSTVRAEYQEAKQELANKNYELCLFKASKAKASVGVILSVFGMRQEQYEELVQTKLDIVGDLIAEESVKQAFPILGYSYYEYANSLKETDVVSSLLYTEYALELGNLDMYFKNGNTLRKQKERVDYDKLALLLLGIIIGITITIPFTLRKKRSLLIDIRK